MRLRWLLSALPTMVMLAVPARAQPVCAEMPARPAAISVTFFGVSTILVRAGDQAIMVDGFFSRPSLFRAGLPLDSHEERINRGLQTARLRRRGASDPPGGVRLRALLVAQGHHDHSMDAARVAFETGATLVGSRSTANIVSGSHPSVDIVTVGTGLERCFGPFGVRAIRSPHSRGFVPWLVYGTVREPMLSRRMALAYRDTVNFSFLITYGDRRILVHPSANYPRRRAPGRALGDIRADLVFLSIGDVDGRDEVFTSRYWDELVPPSRAKVVVPIHWDDFFQSVPPAGAVTSPRRAGDPLHGLPPPRSERDFDRAMLRINALAARDCVQVRFLQAFDEASLDRLVSDGTAHQASCLARRGAGEAR